MALEDFTADLLAGHLGDWFRVAVAEGTAFEAQLITVTPHRSGEGASDGGRTPFSLVFRGPGDPVVPQATYRMVHHELGELDIFIVPIGPDAEGMCYEAVFT